MSYDENKTENNLPEITITKEKVFNYLLALGVNSSYRSYDADSKKFYNEFISMPLKDILPAWERYDGSVKTQIIDNNIDDLRIWVDSRSK